MAANDSVEWRCTLGYLGQQRSEEAFGYKGSVALTFQKKEALKMLVSDSGI
jgi:hypothetical protein